MKHCVTSQYWLYYTVLYYILQCMWSVLFCVLTFHGKTNTCLFATHIMQQVTKGSGPLLFLAKLGTRSQVARLPLSSPMWLGTDFQVKPTPNGPKWIVDSIPTFHNLLKIDNSAHTSWWATLYYRVFFLTRPPQIFLSTELALPQQQNFI